MQAPPQLLLRGQHQQHDLLLVGREGLLRPDPLPQAGPHQLGGSEEKQLIPVSWTGGNTLSEALRQTPTDLYNKGLIDPRPVIHSYIPLICGLLPLTGKQDISPCFYWIITITIFDIQHRQRRSMITNILQNWFLSLFATMTTSNVLRTVCYNSPPLPPLHY